MTRLCTYPNALACPRSSPWGAERMPAPIPWDTYHRRVLYLRGIASSFFSSNKRSMFSLESLFCSVQPSDKLPRPSQMNFQGLSHTVKKPSPETISFHPKITACSVWLYTLKNASSMKLKPCMFMLRMASQGKTNVCKNIYQGILFIFQIDTGRAHGIFRDRLKTGPEACWQVDTFSGHLTGTQTP